MIIIKCYGIALLIVLYCFCAFPQQSKLSKAVNYLSDYIASQDFSELKKTSTDLALVDSMYKKAVTFTNKDYSEALLALTFTSIPYREVPIVVPLIKSLVHFPLVSADDSTFKLKNENLPRYLFFDTPEDRYGDVDKLAHFFGNSFISYSENILDLSHLIGYFVESFEEDFKVASRVDYRDLDVNSYGDYFGKLLEEHNELLPSQVMLIRSLRNFSFAK
jgi:hypothetical protein